MFFPEIRLTITLGLLFILPGAAVLAGAGYAQKLPTLTRWCLAVLVSLALYPVFFYGLRALAPTFSVQPPHLALLLTGCGLWLGWRWRAGEWRAWVQLEPLEWLALGVVGATLFTRFWIIRDQPYPAWTDSLHHVLLTDLTAMHGILPTTLEPYAPIPLNQYHLGLYALSGSVQMLAQVPAHMALLWTAQALNGLCGIGLYVVLERKVGRVSGIVGLVVVGLLSHQPAWYVNWGRFTQLAGQVILLGAWWLAWEAWRAWRDWPAERRQIIWLTVVSAILLGGVALMHFRVMAFLMPLALLAAVVEGRAVWQNQPQRMRLLAGIGITSLSVLVLISPALWDALQVYTALSATPFNATSQAVYFDWSLEALPPLMAHPWLTGLAALSAALGAVRRQPLTWLGVGWLVGLTLIGNAYLLGSRLLSLTNFSGVLILFYLPFGLLIGVAAESLLAWAGPHRAQVTPLFLSLVLLAGFGASQVRGLEVEPYRYFVTPADVPALEWIKANTPPDAEFAINFVFWFPTFPHGTDAGYWIPYFTGRSTNAVTMLLNFAPADYRTRAKQASDAVLLLETSNKAVATLKALGYDYIYIGARGNFARPGLNPEQLRKAPGLKLVYEADGVYIFAIK